MSDLPEPLTPPECDLRDFQYMPLDVVRFAQSDLVALEEPAAVLANILLWGASWHSVPTASLTDDDRVLARLAGYGRSVTEWRSIREGALHGWVKCSDGMLYHPVVAEKALEAWDAKLKQRHRTVCAGVRKYNERNPNAKITPPTFDEWDAAGRPESVTPDRRGSSRVTKSDVTRDMGTASRVTDIGQGEPDNQSSLIKDDPRQPSSDEKGEDSAKTTMSHVTESDVTRDEGGMSRDCHAKNGSKGREGKGRDYIDRPSVSSISEANRPEGVFLPAVIDQPDTAQIAFERHDALRREFVTNARSVEFTPERKRHMAARLKEIGGLGSWDEVLSIIRRSSFLRGDAARNGFVAVIDWILKPANLRKVREGNYDDDDQRNHLLATTGGGAAQRPRSAVDAVHRAITALGAGG
ncbi:DUF1376 domain-containing protein [Novosphingobium resinovorum]|uniref:DUF1376 domain-containing protein n=1 Tax=Novosphingobium resinovorum TaxID=158500 RepID=UPI002ED6A628|nr:hypothetical protein [Novosphingobium resinovorum]